MGGVRPEVGRMLEVSVGVQVRDGGGDGDGTDTGPSNTESLVTACLWS